MNLLMLTASFYRSDSVYCQFLELECLLPVSETRVFIASGAIVFISSEAIVFTARGNASGAIVFTASL